MDMAIMGMDIRKVTKVMVIHLLVMGTIQLDTERDMTTIDLMDTKDTVTEAVMRVPMVTVTVQVATVVVVVK